MAIIAPPNYTQIPNVIFDYWMPKLKANEFMVLMCLCRKIFGWHKSTDSISRNQLTKCTGLSKNTVKDALDNLEKFGLVIKVQESGEFGNKPNKFHLNIQIPIDQIYSDEEDLAGGDQNLGGGRSNIDQGVGQILTGGVGQILTTQKKDLTKERLTKEREATAPSLAPPPSKSKKEVPAPEPKKIYFENVELTDKEYSRLLENYGLEKLKWMLAFLSAKIGANKGYKEKYTSHYHVLLPANWVNKAYLEEMESKAKTTGVKSNREKVMERFKHGESYNGAECYITENEIAFQRGQMNKSVKFKEFGFMDQFNNMLRIFGIKT